MAILCWSRPKCFLRYLVNSYRSRTFVIVIFLLCLYPLLLPLQLQTVERFNKDHNAIDKTHHLIHICSNGKEIDNYTMLHLEKLNMKIKQLEEKLENVQNRKEGFHQKMEQLNNPESSDNKSICGIASFEGYSSCSARLQYLKESWLSDSCYAEWGVNGTECSILEYLSEVESWCPVSAKRPNRTQIYSASTSETLTVRENFSALNKMIGEGINFAWILTRIERMKEIWYDSARRIASKADFQKFQKKKILIHPGLLSMELDWGVGQKAYTGGPLGELVQWADLIAALYVLGHEVTVTTSKNDLKIIFENYFYTIKSISCPLRKHLFDLIYTDITGLQMLKKVSNNYFRLLHCNLRIVDSFGTEPEYNYPKYADRKYKKSVWGKWNLWPKQFNTMFPHTPDNTFLGFVNDILSNNSATRIEKQHMALVYGKQGDFWEGNEKYLKAIQELIPLHATTHIDESFKFVPAYVVNHGVLTEEKFHSLLQSAKIFVGMGFPYEGPAPLEAIANGAVFLNVKFKKNSSLANNVEKFYLDKPTSRRSTSQHPYAEQFIGSPFVRAVYMENVEDVKSIVKDILESPSINRYLPYEFTAIGMLERLALLVEKQDFCYRKSSWPPLSSLRVTTSDEILTCAEACSKAGLICEPDFFPYVNQRSTFKRLGIMCETFVQPSGDFEELDYPSYQGKRCYIQGEHKLFSCSGRYTKTRRICPCRDFKIGQVALCKSCSLGRD